MFVTLSQERFHDDVVRADDDRLRGLHATYDGLADLLAGRADEYAWKLATVREELARRGL